MMKTMVGTALWLPDGIVAEACKSSGRIYSMRPEQAKMAGIIEQALSRQDTQPVGIVPIEAGTGTGKTLAYLVPGAIHARFRDRRMLVSTHTIALGEQILRKDGPIVREIVRKLIGGDVSVAHMRGKRHFVSPSRLRATANLMKDDGSPASSWSPYFEIADAAFRAAALASEMEKDGVDWDVAQDLIDECLIDRIEDQRGLALPKDDISILSSSPPDELSVYRISRDLAERATLLVTTHAFTAISLARRTLLGTDTEPYDMLVVDEADQWASAAASVSLVSVSIADLTRSIERLGEATRHLKRAEEITDLVAEASERVAVLASLAPQERDRLQPIPQNDPALLRLSLVVASLGDLAQLAAKRRSHTAASVDDVKEKTDDLRRILRAVSSNETDFWQPRWTTSRVRGLPSINISGRAPGRLLKRLWTTGDEPPLARTVVLTSATLSTPGFGETSRWNAIQIATGADPASGLVLADLAATIQPIHFGTMRVRFADPRAPVPSIGDREHLSSAAADYAAAVVLEAMKESAVVGGRTLVLVPSYADVEELSKRVPDVGMEPHVVLHRPGTPLQKVLDIYRETPGCCLITPAAWVGADLPGMIQNLVITRIPFPPASEGTPANHYVQSFSQMLTKLAQGIGRAIRCETDNVTLWFADPRMPIPDCLSDETGLLPAPQSKPALLSAIPARFLKRFGVDPGAAKIAVAVVETRQADAGAGTRPKQSPAARGAGRSSAGRTGRARVRAGV